MIFLNVGFSTLDFLWRFNHKNFAFVHFEQSLFASNISVFATNILMKFQIFKMLHFFASDCFCSLRTFFIRSEHSVFASNILRSLRTFCVRFEHSAFASNVFHSLWTFFIRFEHSYKVSNFQNGAFVRCEHFLLALNIFYSLQIFFVRYDHFMFPANIILFDSNI